MRTVLSNEARKSRCSRVIWLAHQSANGPGISDGALPSNSSIRPRSALPRTKRARSSFINRSMVSAGIGPDATSPHTTTTSGSSRLGSPGTAASRGRLPWMSEIAATRTGLGRLVLDPPRPRLGRVVVGIWTIQSDTVGVAALIELRADHVPALAQVKHAMVPLGGPALRRDAHPVTFGHSGQSTWVRLFTNAPTQANPPNTIASTNPSIRSGALKPNLIELTSTAAPPIRTPRARPNSHGLGIPVERTAGHPHV